MSSFQVNSKNRNAAKRLLNAWFDSRHVRTWPLKKLQSNLEQKVQQGMITDSRVRQILEAETIPPKSTEDRPAGEAPPEKYDSQEELDVPAGEKDGGQDSGDGDKDAESGEGQGDEKSSGDGSEAQQGEGDENGDGDKGEQDSDQGQNESPQPPPPLDSEQPFVTHPELQEARAADQEYTRDVAKHESAALGRIVDKVVYDALDRIEALEKRPVQKPKPSTIKVKIPELPEVEIDSPHKEFKRVLQYVSAGLNVALVGPAGTGKSYLSRQVAKALARDYYTNGALLSKYELIGYNDAGGTYHETPAYQAYTQGGVHCFDELDASAPEAVVAFNGMTDDQGVYAFPNGLKEKHSDYVAIACMNTFGTGANADYVGRFKQDAAAMDRYVRVFIDYDVDVERTLAGEHTDILERVWEVRKVCDKLKIRHIVSTRMIIKAVKARLAGAKRVDIDRDIIFCGLEDSTIKTIKGSMQRA